MAALIVVVAGGAEPRAEVRLPAVISSHMVVEQQSEVAIWGWGAAGERVTVSASWGAAAKTTCDAAGRWRVNLKTPAAGGPFTLDVAGKNAIHLDDVLVGEVWLCGGQSNMEWSLADPVVVNADAERAAANDPRVRLFDVPNVVAAAPTDDCNAHWLPVTSESVNHFSCVGWFFARELRKALDVPVGLIGVNWGGTVAQAWVRREALAPFPRFAGELAWVASEAGDSGGAERRKSESWSRWFAALDEKDLGSRNGWATREFDDSRWTEAALPGLWRGELQGFDGVVWYRRSLEFPPDLAGKEVDLELGPIDDMDTVWLDGKKIGGMELPGFWNAPRRYRIPAELVTAGRHLLALRVIDTGGEGGMTGEASSCGLRLAAAPDVTVALSGSWRFRVSMAASDLVAMPRMAQLHANVASVLWNGMLAPIVPYGIRGALWYQGESNRGHAAEYADLMPALIADWRVRFERPDFPFLFVQIAPFNYGDPSGAATAELRQAQLETLRVKNSGMVVTTDVGDAGNIHPANKQEVGRRLALWALARTYGKDVGEWSGPLVESMKVEGRRVRVKFSHAAGGLVARGGPLTDFEVCGADGKWTEASATIDGDSVVVSSDAVREPKEARFGFADAPSPNLFNGAGLPASPFGRIAR